MNSGRKRSSFSIMRRMLKLVKPLAGHMVLSVVLGVLGFLCAISVTVLGSLALYRAMSSDTAQTAKQLFVVVLILAVLRGVLHYGEQNRNHFIAFTLLALIRDRVFASLRRLAPAKLDTKEKGALISMITSDIELLEVFYAHTISPVCIAVLTCAIMLAFFGTLHPWFILIAACSYVLVGAVIPLVSSKFVKEDGLRFRAGAASLSSFLLDSMRGLLETIRYHGATRRMEEMDARTDDQNAIQKRLKFHEGISGGVTDAAILMCSLAMLLAGLSLYQKGQIAVWAVLLSTVGMLSSFGPVVALSNLSGSLTLTLASGERVLDLLDETPEVQDVTNGKDVTFCGMRAEHVEFSYGHENVLQNFSAAVPQTGILSITGPSGSGKSTALKLLMRFRDPNSGKITMSGEDLRSVNTKSLRNNQAYVTQETQLFNDTIENNIKIADLSASHEAVVEAAKKASVHDFIETLPQGYDTNVGELGDLLSDGEKQRIGLARAFLSDAPLILLDEPTSNLDTLNEGHILQVLERAKKEKSIVLVSHRPSAKAVADTSVTVESGRVS